MTAWLKICCDQELEDKSLWNALLKFLEKEIRIQQQMLLLSGKQLEQSNRNENKNEKPKSEPRYENTNSRRQSSQQQSYHSSERHSSRDQPSNEKCHFCSGDQHIKTRGPYGDITQYFACEKFAKMTTLERYKELRKLGFCMQCLFPGARQNTGRHRDGKFQVEFCCKHPSHNRYKSKKHVLVCSDHCNDEENQKIPDEYKARCIIKNETLPAFPKDIQIKSTPPPQATSMTHIQASSTSDESAIYILQTIEVDNKTYNLFFNTGCSDFVCRYNAVQDISARASHEWSGTISVGGVGEISAQSQHGIYKVSLPLHDNTEALLLGACLDTVTEFPCYPLQSRATFTARIVSTVTSLTIFQSCQNPLV